MVARVIAVLLAIGMMVGAATQVYAASGAGANDVWSVLDDAPDIAVPVVSEPVAVTPPAVWLPVFAAPPDPALGRAHDDVIFRPPR